MDLKHRVQNFWKYFETIREEYEEALSAQDQDQILKFQKDCNEQLKDICGCKMETEFSDSGFYEMTFDCSLDKTSQYCCALLKKDAPKTMVENWIINAYRQPLSEKAMHMVFEADGKQYSGHQIKVYYEIDEMNKCLHTKLFCEGFLPLNEVRRQEIASFMMELFIGVLEYEARIGSMEILEEDIDEENVCLLSNFYEDICDIIIEQDWLEYHDPTQIYSAYKLDDSLKSETLRKDMKLIVTTHPALQEELLNKEDFLCREFADRGGEFGYLYYIPEQEKEQIALVRQQLEKEINDLLYPMSIARTIGGAIGIHYAYIDVAVFDRYGFDIVLEKMKETLPFPIYYKSFLG